MKGGMSDVPPRLTTAAGVLCVLYVYRTFPEESTALEARKALTSTVRTLGAILWPHILLSLLPEKDRSRGVIMIPLLWNPLVWALDSYLLYNASSNDDDVRPASLRFDASSIIGLSFGLSGLLGSRPDGEHVHLFLYAIVSCVVLALPSHNLQEDSPEEQLFESVQKAAVIWCLGLLIAGVVFTRIAKTIDMENTAPSK